MTALYAYEPSDPDAEWEAARDLALDQAESRAADEMERRRDAWEDAMRDRPDYWDGAA